MVHLTNALCGTVLVYTFVTRGSLVFARGLEYVLRKTR